MYVLIAGSIFPSVGGKRGKLVTNQLFQLISFVCGLVLPVVLFVLAAIFNWLCENTVKESVSIFQEGTVFKTFHHVFLTREIYVSVSFNFTGIARPNWKWWVIFSCVIFVLCNVVNAVWIFHTVEFPYVLWCFRHLEWSYRWDLPTAWMKLFERLFRCRKCFIFDVVPFLECRFILSVLWRTEVVVFTLGEWFHLFCLRTVSQITIETSRAESEMLLLVLGQRFLFYTNVIFCCRLCTWH